MASFAPDAALDIGQEEGGMFFGPADYSANVPGAEPPQQMEMNGVHGQGNDLGLQILTLLEQGFTGDDALVGIQIYRRPREGFLRPLV